MVVEYDADDGAGWVMFIQTFEQADEFHAAMARLDVGDDFPGVQIQCSEDRQRAMTNVLVIAPDA